MLKPAVLVFLLLMVSLFSGACSSASPTTVPVPAPTSMTTTAPPGTTPAPAQTPPATATTAPTPSPGTPVTNPPTATTATQTATPPAITPSPPPPPATTPAMTRGTVDPDIVVDVYDPALAYDGTTLLPDNHNPDRPRIIEVNMLGEIIWQYVLPDDVKKYTNPGFDVERLANDDVLFLLPGKGIYEINRSGKVVWSFIDPRVSHDADRLPNGNTLFVFGNNDQKTDPQVREIDPSGKVVWSWYARDYFDKAPYADINREGWSHTNAVTRLANGNTLISLRNFNQVVEVSPDGQIVRTYGLDIFIDQHDPEMLPNGNLLVANHGQLQAAIEIDPKIRQVVWHSPGFKPEDSPVRDADRLPNGNTLITAATKLVEVTSDGKTVWQMKLKNANFAQGNAPGLGFYTAERIGASNK